MGWGGGKRVHKEWGGEEVRGYRSIHKEWDGEEVRGYRSIHKEWDGEEVRGYRSIHKEWVGEELRAIHKEWDPLTRIRCGSSDYRGSPQTCPIHGRHTDEVRCVPP